MRKASFSAYVLLGFTLLGSALIINQAVINRLLIIIATILLTVGLWEYYTRIRSVPPTKVEIGEFRIILILVPSVIITWFLNHSMDLGPVIANGLVGVTAGLVFPRNLAASIYAASFVGMSSITVLPNIFSTLIGGIIISFILIFTKEIFLGIGGKGGTAAALATQLTRVLVKLIMGG